MTSTPLPTMTSAPRSPKQDFFTTFHQLCSKVLSPAERNNLHRRLQKYQHNRDVSAFVMATSFVWSSPAKLQLLPFVRKLIVQRDRRRFDVLLGVHEGLVVGGAGSHIPDRSSSLSSTQSGSHPVGRRGGIHVIRIHSSAGASPRMGFSIRGGSEFGLGVFVSQVEPSSPAEASGLRCGDQILEANGVDLENATGQRVAELLGTTLTPTLIVRRTRKVPEWKVTKERILWYDVALKRLVALPSGEVTDVKESGAQARQVVERKVTLKLAKQTDFIGLNIRGGKEYGLGIYVSRVDKGGLAEKAGIRVGDQLVQVNEHRLDGVTHPVAVELLRTGRQFVITAWAIGRFPAYKELFSEYVWSDSEDRRENPRVHTAELHPEPIASARRKTGGRLIQRTRTKETRVDRVSRSSRYDSGIVLNGVDSLHIGDDPDIDNDDDSDDYENLEVRPELFLPRDQDIIFRGNYSENWKRLEKAYGEGSPSATSGTDRRVTHNYRPKLVTGTLDSDSDSSDLDMDYTTFLERKMRRDDGKLTTSSVISSERNVDVANTSGATAVVRQIALDDGLGQSDIYAVVHRPPRSEQRQEFHEVRRTDRQEVHSVGQPDVYVVKPHKPPRSEQRQAFHDVRQIERIETHAAGQSVVRKSSQAEQRQNNVAVSRTAVERSSTSDYYSHSPNGTRASTSRSSSDSNNSNADRHQHRHRTHVYHINGSPTDDFLGSDSSTAVTAVRAPTTHSNRTCHDNTTSDYHSGGGGDNNDHTVVTEVLDEMTTSFRALPPDSKGSLAGPQFQPPELARQNSEDDSSSSESESPPTTPTLTAVAGVQSGEPTTLDLLSAEIKRLEERQSNLGSRELSRLGRPHESSARVDKKPETEEKKPGAWSNIKKKLTGSFRVKKGKKTEQASSPESFSMGSVRKKRVFERTFGSQMMNQHTVDKYNMMMVEERARQLLNKDECAAVLKHIKTYHDNNELERLVELLLTILDRPEKLQLLKDIRGVVYPYHVGRFDNMVASHEVAAYEKLSTQLHLPLSPVHRQDSASKPRPRLMTTVLDKSGHFHIKSVEQYDHETKLQSDVVTTLQHSKSRSFDHLPVPVTTTTSTSSDPNISSNHRNHDYYSNNRQREDTAPLHVVPPPVEWRDDIEVIIVEKDLPPKPPPQSPPQPVEEGMIVYVSKQKKNLGLIVCGGAGDHMDPNVRIDLVMPWGAAADDDRIQAGMHILSVDDQSLRGMIQSEAIAVLKRCFNDKRSVNMKLVLKQP